MSASACRSASKADFDFDCSPAKSAASADERGRIAGPQFECALERRVRAGRIARRELRFAEEDYRLTVIWLRRDQRLQQLDRRRELVLADQRARLLQLIAIVIEHELAGEIPQPALEPRPQRHEGSLQRRA